MHNAEYHLSNHELKYLKLLAGGYPTIQAVYTEIINLQAILNLPKGAEYFTNDLYGGYDIFYYAINNCSGVIREKVDPVFGKTLSDQERFEICTPICYPEQRPRCIKQTGSNLDAQCRGTLYQSIDICRTTAFKYTRPEARKALPPESSYIINEPLHTQPGEDSNQQVYHAGIIDTIIGISSANEFITALYSLVKRLAVDFLHIIGDVFGRDPGADRIVDLLMQYHAVDIGWRNHGILWMDAASDSEACATATVRNTVAGGNLVTPGSGYGTSMRELAVFAKEQYSECGDLNHATRKATSVILSKLEDQLIRRRPEFQMEHQMLLYQVSYEQGTIEIEDKTYEFSTTVFPTVNYKNPYELIEEEKNILHGLVEDFKEDERLNRHMRFLYMRGSMYECFNQSLLFRRCVPMTTDGELIGVNIEGRIVEGKKLMNLPDKLVHRVCFIPPTVVDKPFCLDYMQHLWSGEDSPLFGREKTATFGRIFIGDKSTWTERKNPCYKWYNQEEVCEMLLREFGLNTPLCHTINGHMPIRAGDEESPVKTGGKPTVVDGGLCEAYHPATGIAGYALIYNSHGMCIKSHQPLDGMRGALGENKDIQSRSDTFETHFTRMMVMDTDNGDDIGNQIHDLITLLNAYRQGLLSPKVTK